MNFLPFWKTIIWKSWANRAIAISLGCFAAFAGISATPPDILAFVPALVITGAKSVLATGGFVIGLSATFLRVMTQNFGSDASGNQIVTAIGTAPAGTSPTPPVVVAMPAPTPAPSTPTTPAAAVVVPVKPDAMPQAEWDALSEADKKARSAK